MGILSLDAIAKALKGDISGCEVLCPGPGHSSVDRSLSVRPDDSAPDGFLVHSFCGDDPIACKDFVREKLGLDPFKPKGKVGNGGDRAWQVVAEYVYHDEHGAPYLRVRRCIDGKGRKSYPQSHWTGTAWVSGEPDGPRLPYRLPELIAASPTAPVLVPEGEKCVDALAKLGFVATCNPGGSDSGKGLKWTADLNKWFVGRNVVLLPDNDQPGRRHVEHVAKQLHGVANSVRVLDLAEHWPGPDPAAKGDDVADYIAQFDRAGSRLAQLVKEAPSWQPPEASAASGSDGVGDDDGLIQELAGLSPLLYAKRRKAAASKIGITASDLDRLVKAARPKPEDDDKDLDKQGRAISFLETEMWDEEVDGATVLDALADTIGNHVVMPAHARDVAALWVIHTYLLDCFMVSPRLAIRSPMKRCGKTTLLDVLARLVWRPLPTANVTPAAVFRVVEKYRPTLLVDEADTFLREHDELRGVINSGHRKGGSVLRTVGDNHEPRQFSTYAAVAIALIGNLPDTLADRSVTVDLKRRLPSEKITVFRAGHTGHLDEIASQVFRWAQDHVIAVGALDPEMPADVFNREADNWGPLLQIADVAGGHWPERARKAAALSREAADDDDSRLVVLLGDVRDIFAGLAEDRIASADLAKALAEIEGRPWAEYGKTGKPLTQNQLARLLKPLAIAPDRIWIGEERVRGYLAYWFAEAFSRYLPSEGSRNRPPDPCSTAPGTSDLSATVHNEIDWTVAEGQETPAAQQHGTGGRLQEGGEGSSPENPRWRGRI